MGNCVLQCTYFSANENIYRDFFDNIKVRRVSPKQWSEAVIKKLGRFAKKVKSEDWNELIQNYLIWPENKEVSINIWKYAIQYSEQTGGQYLLLFSILFLCSNNQEEIKQEFSTFGNLFTKSDMLEEKNLIKKERLYSIVSSYVNLVSLFVSDKINVLASDQKSFQETAKQSFSLNVQKLYLDKEVFNGFDDEMISIDNFLQAQYQNLQNDSYIRERLSFLCEKKKIEN